MRFYDLIYGIIIAPQKTIQKIKKYEPVAAGFLVLFISAFILGITNANLILTSNIISFLPVIIVSVFGYIFGAIFLSLVLVFLSKFLGGTGDYFALFTGLSLSTIVFIFLPVGLFIAEFTSILMISDFVRVLIFIWYLLLAIEVIRKTQEISLFSSLLTITGSFASLIVITLLISVSLAGSFIVFFG
ncbi:MAG: YIP1 family protein [Halarsenatibacteraceae bacterium]